MTAGVEEGLNELRHSLAEEVIDPAHAEYEAARRCFNALALGLLETRTWEGSGNVLVRYEVRDEG